MPHIIQRSTLKDTLNDILHVLGKVQIGRIGIPKQIRGEIFDTLSPRGVCSRIPHSGVCPPQHVPLLVHAYAAYYTIFSELRVEELGVEELAGAGAFQDALQ